MSGHSKWATIKHKKAATDARRGKVFTKTLKEITVAARLGGGDVKGNPRLRAAVLEARANSVPNDTIDRAIKKGTGDLEGEIYEEIILEGYGPGGVAILVESTTDNRNRTVGEVRHLFTRHGGALAEPGAVAWMFTRRGYFAVPKSGLDEDAFMQLALDLGAEDAASGGEVDEIFTTVEDFLRVQEELEKRGVATAVRELAMIPQNYVELPADKARAMIRLMEALEDHDDVQKVWANFDIPDTVLAEQER
ncbi:MAG TPA: YebC/PmpR family DNA-binding transcriptional regulator [Thermoanaerobaculia bacterium]|nr:YebC/PmpR family DNA-binding transcriptional regulator [Thermoanaerobaculia bacterium]